MSPSVKVSEHHMEQLETIQDQMTFTASKKAIVEGLIDDHLDGNPSGDE